MNSAFAIAAAGVMLVILGRSLFNLIKEARALDAPNRRLMLFTLVAVMLGFVAMLIIVHSVRLGCLQWDVWSESCPRG